MTNARPSPPLTRAIEAYGRLNPRQRAIFDRVIGRSQSEPVYEPARPIVASPASDPWVTPLPPAGASLDEDAAPK